MKKKSIVEIDVKDMNKDEIVQMITDLRVVLNEYQVKYQFSSEGLAPPDTCSFCFQTEETTGLMVKARGAKICKNCATVAIRKLLNKKAAKTQEQFVLILDAENKT